MRRTAQASIEAMLILVIAFVCIVISVGIAWDQIVIYNDVQQKTIAGDAVNLLANEADDVYFTGPGSVKTVRIIIPDGVDLDESFIRSNSIVLRVNGSDFIKTTRASVRGNFPNSSGAFTFTISSSGDFVTISASNLLFSPNRIEEQLNQSESRTIDLNIINNSEDPQSYTFSIDFNEGLAFVSSPSEGAMNFSASEEKQISLTVSCSRSAVGSYFGSLVFAGDFNSTLPIIITCKSAQSRLGIYPFDTNVSVLENSSLLESILVCNNSSFDYNSITAFFSGTVSSYATLQNISSIPQNSCVDANIVFNAPSFGVLNNYDGNLTLRGNSFSSTSSVRMTVYQSGANYFFRSVANRDINHNFDFNGFVYKNSDLNAFLATGERDWNRNANYSFQSADFNRDMNGLVGYWKMNDKNSQGWVLNSATGVRDGQLVGGADINSVGMWDTNAGYFDGTGDYIDAGSNTVLGANPFTLSAWINPSIVNKYQGAISIGSSSTGASAYIGTVAAAQVGTSNSIGGGFYGSNYGSGVTTRNSWTQVVLTYNGVTATLFVNGLRKIDNNYVPNLASNYKRIGRICSDSSYDFNGLIDEVKLYNRALSADEVLRDYNYFLNAKFSDSNIIAAASVIDWNLVKINKDINYSFGKEIISGEKFFDQNLIGLWHLNDKNSSGWVLNSATGVRDANISGGADTNAVGLWDTNAAWFNGTGRISTSLNTALNDFSVSVWFKDNGVVGSYERLVDKSYTGGFWIGRNSTSANSWGGGIKESSSPYGIYAFFLDGAWNHLVSIRRGTTHELYANGVLVNWNTVSSSALDTTRVTFGNGTTNEALGGIVEEVAIWNRALFASEVKDLYRKGVARLDLNFYSCSDASCSTKTSSQYVSDANNNSWMSISSISNSRYLGFDAFFRPANGINDRNAGTFWVGSYLKDINVSYTG